MLVTNMQSNIDLGEYPLPVQRAFMGRSATQSKLEGRLGALY